MILALLAVAAPVIAPQAAYTAGRCYVHLTDDAKVDAMRQLEADPNAAALLKLYYQGVQDSRTKPLSATRCQRLLDPGEGATPT